MVLENKKDFTLESLTAAAFDNYLPWFETPMPALIKAWDQDLDSNPLKANLADQIGLLRTWNLRWGVVRSHVARGVLGRGYRAIREPRCEKCRHTRVRLCRQQSTGGAATALAGGSIRSSNGGLRNVEDALGKINRFQRLDDNMVSHFDDAKPSIPVGFTSAGTVGLAGVFWRARVPGNEEVVRHQRKQLRRCG